MENILIIRLSSMGDVALTVPVISSLEQNYPDLNIHLLTRKAFVPLFKGFKINFIIPDLYGRHKGLTGLYRLYKELAREAKFDAVFDLHDVLRTKVLRFFFKIGGVKVYVIDKGRNGKKALTRKENKILIPLSSTVDRYHNTLKEVFDINPLAFNPRRDIYQLSSHAKEILGPKDNYRIGVAPFARHKQKMYPLEKMDNVIRTLTTEGYRVYLFGGGEKETKLAERMVAENNQITSLVGSFSLDEELALLKEMDLMLTMDSANMHLAALMGTRVISIWGGTHYYAGFGPVNQPDTDQMIQISPKDLNCRPCSVFGNKPCYRGDWACLGQITEDSIISKVKQYLN